jgi:hypothetical protein
MADASMRWNDRSKWSPADELAFYVSAGLANLMIPCLVSRQHPPPASHSEQKREPIAKLLKARRKTRSADAER